MSDSEGAVPVHPLRPNFPAGDATANSVPVDGHCLVSSRAVYAVCIWCVNRTLSAMSVKSVMSGSSVSDVDGRRCAVNVYGVIDSVDGDCASDTVCVNCTVCATTVTCVYNRIDIVHITDRRCPTGVTDTVCGIYRAAAYST